MENLIDVYILKEIHETQDLLSHILENKELMSNIEKSVDICYECFESKNKIYFAGNGGSAADAQHMAGEFVSRFAFDRPGLSAFSLSTDTSVITAIGNDYGYESLFSRQLEAHARPGDVFVAYSTSGISPNIIRALEVAKGMGVTNIGFTGSGGLMNEYCESLIQVPSVNTPKIQEIHLVIGHIICGLVEKRIFKDSI